MTSHLPPVPPANRSPKGPHPEGHVTQDTTVKHPERSNSSEKGDTANIAQNTTNKGFFQGRRVK